MSCSIGYWLISVPQDWDRLAIDYDQSVKLQTGSRRRTCGQGADSGARCGGAVVSDHYPENPLDMLLCYLRQGSDQQVKQIANEAGSVARAAHGRLSIHERPSDAAVCFRVLSYSELIVENCSKNKNMLFVILRGKTSSQKRYRRSNIT